MYHFSHFATDVNIQFEWTAQEKQKKNYAFYYPNSFILITISELRTRRTYMSARILAMHKSAYIAHHTSRVDQQYLQLTCVEKKVANRTVVRQNTKSTAFSTSSRRWDILSQKSGIYQPVVRNSSVVLIMLISFSFPYVISIAYLPQGLTQRTIENIAFFQ